MGFLSDLPAYLKAEIAVAEAGLVLMAVNILGASLHLFNSLNYLCLVMPAVLLAVGLMGFVRDGVTIVPKGAGVLEFRKIYVYNPLIPFLVAIAALYIYYRIGIFVLALLLTLLGPGIAIMLFLILTVLYFIFFAFVLLFSGDVTVVEIEGDEIRIKKSSKVYRAPIKEVDIVTGDILRNFGITPKEKLAYIRSNKWAVEIKNFRDEKAFQKFYSYMYYRLNPDKYLEARMSKSAR